MEQCAQRTKKRGNLAVCKNIAKQVTAGWYHRPADDLNCIPKKAAEVSGKHRGSGTKCRCPLVQLQVQACDPALSADLAGKNDADCKNYQNRMLNFHEIYKKAIFWHPILSEK